MHESESKECGLVVYDSKFGNTEKVARSLANGLKLAGVDAACLNTNDVQLEAVKEYDLIALGAPTQAFTASRPMKDFLRKLGDAGSLNGKQGFAFDTKLRSRFSGSAAKFIEKQLIELGVEIIMPRESAIVKGTEGPLDESEQHDFERIGFEIGTRLGKHEKQH